MATKKYLDDNGLTYYHSKVKTLLADKVDKETGKGLSTNDYTDNEKTKLANIETGAEVNTIDIVKVNGTELTPDSNKAVNVTVPTKITDLTDDSDFVKSTDLAEVATSGDYGDLINTPTIPTVNNATITIQKNGTDVDSFTANQATAKTVNITVPTTAADVNALPDSTKYGASLALAIDSTTYVVTATLKDQDGNTLGTAQTIDLPLESVVVSGSYDAQTKEVVLTLQGGSTIRFSVADLVSGLQTEITSTNMLDADLVDDATASHKFATAAQLSKLDGLANITTIGTNLNLTNGTLTATDTTYNDFIGTDGTTAGTAGLVPAPATTEAGGYLRADGTWSDPTFTLPTASATVLGGIKVGTNLSINASTGVLSATDTTYTQGTGITITGTTISMADTYTAVTNAEIDTIVAS